MAKRRKQTPTQKAYYKERRRIQSFIRRAEKRGYIFDAGILPEIPKKITAASVRRLKALTPKELYKKSRVVIEETGEIISGTHARNIERSISAQKAAHTRRTRTTRTDRTSGAWDEAIIRQWYANVAMFPHVLEPMFKAWITKMFSMYSRHDVAVALQRAAEKEMWFTYKEAYKEGLLFEKLSEITRLVPDITPGYVDQIIEDLIANEWWEIPR